MIDFSAELSFLVVGPAPKNKIWAAFALENDARQFAKTVVYGRVILSSEYDNEPALRSSSR